MEHTTLEWFFGDNNNTPITMDDAVTNKNLAYKWLEDHEIISPIHEYHQYVDWFEKTEKTFRLIIDRNLLLARNCEIHMTYAQVCFQVNMHWRMELYSHKNTWKYLDQIIKLDPLTIHSFTKDQLKRIKNNNQMSVFDALLSTRECMFSHFKSLRDYFDNIRKKPNGIYDHHVNKKDINDLDFKLEELKKLLDIYIWTVNIYKKFMPDIPLFPTDEQEITYTFSELQPVTSLGIFSWLNPFKKKTSSKQPPHRPHIEIYRNKEKADEWLKEHNAIDPVRAYERANSTYKAWQRTLLTLLEERKDLDEKITPIWSKAYDCYLAHMQYRRQRFPNDGNLPDIEISVAVEPNIIDCLDSEQKKQVHRTSMPLYYAVVYTETCLFRFMNQIVDMIVKQKEKDDKMHDEFQGPTIEKETTDSMIALGKLFKTRLDEYVHTANIYARYYPNVPLHPKQYDEPQKEIKVEKAIPVYGPMTTQEFWIIKTAEDAREYIEKKGNLTPLEAYEKFSKRFYELIDQLLTKANPQRKIIEAHEYGFHEREHENCMAMVGNTSMKLIITKNTLMDMLEDGFSTGHYSERVEISKTQQKALTKAQKKKWSREDSMMLGNAICQFYESLEYRCKKIVRLFQQANEYHFDHSENYLDMLRDDFNDMLKSLDLYIFIATLYKKFNFGDDLFPDPETRDEYYEEKYTKPEDPSDDLPDETTPNASDETSETTPTKITPPPREHTFHTTKPKRRHSLTKQASFRLIPFIVARQF